MPKYLIIFIIFILVLPVFLNSQNTNNSSDIKDFIVRRVAILPVVNMSQSDEYDYLSPVIADSLKASLIDTKSFLFIDEKKIALTLTQNNISKGDSIWEDDAISLGEGLGADIIIIASFSIKKEEITIFFNAIDIKARRSATKMKTTGKSGIEVLDVVKKASSDMTAQLLKDFSPYQKRFEDFKRVIIFKFQQQDIDDNSNDNIISLLSTQINNRKKYFVIEDSELQSTLNELNVKNDGKITPADALKVGQKLIVDLIIMGKIKKEKSFSTLSLKVFDAKTGKIKFDKIVVYSNLNSLNTSIDDITNMIHNTRTILTTNNIIGINLTAGGSTLLLGGTILTVYDTLYYFPEVIKLKVMENDRNTTGYNDYLNAFNNYSGMLSGSIAMLSIGGVMAVTGIPFIIYREKIQPVKTAKAINLKVGYDFRIKKGIDIAFKIDF